MVNTCIKECPTDIMIFCSKKARPTNSDIKRLVDKINSGYGYVGLYRFAFFGIHKKTINHIGWLDEKFIWGSCEDDDFRIRLNLKNIGFYEDHSCKYIPSKSSYESAIAFK